MSEASIRLTAPANHLPEWRQALNIAVENYQSTRSWYEENQDSPSAEQDMDAAAGEIDKIMKQYGVLIVLSLLDEVGELQEHPKAAGPELKPANLVNKFYERYPAASFKSDTERASALGYFMAGAELQCFGEFVKYEDLYSDE